METGNWLDMKEEHNNCCKTPVQLYKIGMFAQMNRITVKTLRFYEEQGLLSPAFVDCESGYRYYSMAQMAVVHQISALKESGFTLEDIRKVNSGAEEELLLQQKKSQLAMKIAELSRQVAMIDNYLLHKNTSLKTPVLVRTIPACKVAVYRTGISSYDDLFGLMPEMGLAMEKLGYSCALPEYCFTQYCEMDLQEGEGTVEICEAVNEDRGSDGNLFYREEPAVTAACIFHKGSYKSLGLSYKRVLSFVEEQGYTIAGRIRENYIDGVWNKDTEEEWLTEIQVPVLPK